MSADLKRIFLECCVLVAFGALIGLTLNHQLVVDAFSGRLAPPEKAAVAVGVVTALPMPVLIEEVRELRSSGVLIVDARGSELYEMGHIEGAESLPLVDVEQALPEFLTRIPGDQTIILYCSGFGCPDSFDLGVRLLQVGYLDVRVFEGGYPEWRDAGLPIAGGLQ